MSAPTALFLTFNDIDNRWKVVDNKQFCFGDGETQEEAIASARIVSNATIFSDSEPDVIVNRVFDKLFLDFQDDNKFHIINENGQSFAAAYEIPDAIKHVRKITDSPIDIEDSYEGFTRICVPEKPDHAIADTRKFITALAEIAGMEVIEHYDNNVNFLGYTMEPIEEDDFIKSEIAAEKHEKEITSAMSSYLGDDIGEVSR